MFDFHVNVGETPCLVDNWMRIIFALVFVGGVDSGLVTPHDGSKDPTKYIKDYRDKIKDGRKCVTFGILGDDADVAGREYFRVPYSAKYLFGFDVVVHSMECLIHFHFPPFDGAFVGYSKQKLPVNVGDCLDVAEDEMPNVKGVKIDPHAEGYATVQCEFRQNNGQNKPLGEYTFRWHEISLKPIKKLGSDDAIATGTDEDSGHRANKLCASFYLRRKYTRDLIINQFPKKYRDEIKGGRKCETFGISALPGVDDDAEFREYFRCPAKIGGGGGSDVVVHSMMCLFQFHFSLSDGGSLHSSIPVLPVNKGDCLEVGARKKNNVWMGNFDMDENHIVTVKCWFEQKVLGEYRFKWDDVTLVEFEYHMGQFIGPKGVQINYSPSKGNRLCASFHDKWKETRDLLNVPTGTETNSRLNPVDAKEE
jgi:hypothetical protein